MIVGFKPADRYRHLKQNQTMDLTYLSTRQQWLEGRGQVFAPFLRQTSFMKVNGVRNVEGYN